MSAPVVVFDRRAVRRHRERAAAGFAAFDFLHRAGAERLVDRLDVMTRRFDRALEFGAHGRLLGEALAGLGRIDTLVSVDSAPGFARDAVVDEEWVPFAAASFDLVVGNLALHWVNDLPGTLLQLRAAMRPDAPLVVSMLGGRTLAELRDCLIAAETEIAGGVRPRVSPFIDVRDAGALLQRAGFALPVVDADLLTVTYPDALALMRDLRGMGETNALAERSRSFTRRAVLLRAAALYAERYAGGSGRLEATFEIVTLTGWTPSPAQPKPLRPGSATQRLATALGSTETPLDDRGGA
ncbi:MAG: methyltransferase domain-containing protein [Alphaproteobacteria bacterium]|nr:methyltransferase domain-containing protein [Alphaproteobacteria bacterium]